jgi:hypothetical protein
MSSFINQRVRPNLARLILYSLAFTAIVSLRAGAQSADQPFDFELKDGWPGCEVGGWHPWPGHWNLAPMATFYVPPAASLRFSDDNTKILYTVTASSGAGYRGDFLQIFESTPGARYVVTVFARKTVLFKPNDPQAPPVQETYDSSAAQTFNTLAEARAAIPGIDADTLARVPAPAAGPAGNGTYLGEVGTGIVISTVRADSWQLIAKAGTPQTIAGFPNGFNNNDNGMQGQVFSGEVPFDLTSNQGRQLVMERWTLQVTAGGNFRLELQSLDPIDVPNVIPTVELQPLVSTKTISVDGNPMAVTLMTQYEGTKWKAALGREGVQFVIKGTSPLSPITKMEILAKPPESIDWLSIPRQNETIVPPKIGYCSLVSPIAILGQSTIMQTVSVCLGGLGTDPKHMIPRDQSLAGKTWHFQAKITNQKGEEIYSDLIKVDVLLPSKIKTVQGQTLPPASGSDGGNGWFAASPLRDYTFKLWTYGLPE